MPCFSVQVHASNCPTDIALSKILFWLNTLIEADRIYNLFCCPNIYSKCHHLSERDFWDEAPFDWDKYTHLFLDHTKNKFGQILLLSEPYLALAARKRKSRFHPIPDEPKRNHTLNLPWQFELERYFYGRPLSDPNKGHCHKHFLQLL